MNTIRATRLMTRLGVPTLLLCMLVMWWNYGLVRVQKGMDTMSDSLPEGTLCLIDKTPSSLTRDAVVFLDLPDGSTVLSRVSEVLEDGTVQIRHDNRESRFGYLEQAGPYPRSAVRGLVLTMFLP